MTAEKNCENCTYTKFDVRGIDNDCNPEAAEEEYQRREIMEELGYSRYSEGDLYEVSDSEFEGYVTLTCTNKLSSNFKFSVHPKQKCKYWKKKRTLSSHNIDIL